MATFFDKVVNIATIKVPNATTPQTYTVPTGRRAIVYLKFKITGDPTFVSWSGVVNEQYGAGFYEFENVFLNEGDYLSISAAVFSSASVYLTAFEYTNP